MPERTSSARYARRALLSASVFGRRGEDESTAGTAAAADAVRTVTVVTGVVTGVSEYAIAVYGDGGERVLSLTPGTAVWLGARTGPTALRGGDQVIIRQRPQRAGGHGRAPAVAERIWARMGRVTGTIVAVEGREGREFLIDTGRAGRPAERVVVARASLRQVQVRFPRLAPGYLLDVIGTRHPGYLLAVAPATAQPPYLAAHPPAPPLVRGGRSGRLSTVSGTAVWHEPGDEPPSLVGLGYPAIDPETDGAGDGTAAPSVLRHEQGCVRLPYLSLGSTASVRNECTERTAVLPVTSHAAIARQFCDRCVACGTSPKGRVADLTMAAFVELGGNLEDNCFHATLTLADLD